ncbi:outer membrane protein assembly factor BamB [Alteromonas sediminis]|uniref:Outer membrane protein assembly factor BamB n=1 Tax=Alteromonas sediminis TaxID=2259342 RepID=A0A3N5YAA3_9ALTE|nr:outer membrane protein assembly factor BamB [Alteromonas sediminis]RPJ65655.1 outer membrane protein assembly factor BamB [Alteromonas sediminis]
MVTLNKKQLISAVLLATSLSGCSTISDWFAEEEELEIRRLKPIQAQFQVDEVWSRDVGNGVESYFSRLQPVAVGNVVYVADRQGKLYALDAASGNVEWEQDFATYSDEGFFSGVSKLWSDGETARLSSLSHGNGTLYLGSENGVLMALNPENGEVKWQTTVPGEILAPAAVEGDVVVVNTGSGVMFGINANTGEELWRSESDVPPLSLRGISTPVAVSGGVMVGTPTGHLKVNVISSGLTAWETAIATPTGATELERIVDIDSTPLLFANTVYTVAYNGTLAAVELRSGRVLWKREYGSFRNVTLSGNTLFVVDTNSNIYALDRRNGVEIWAQGQIKGRRLTSAVPFGDHVVVGDNWGYLHWINKQDGSIEARYNLGGDDEDESVFADPLVVNGTLLAMTREGELAALSPVNQ